MPQVSEKYSLRQPRLWAIIKKQMDHGQTPRRSLPGEPTTRGAGEGIDLDPLLSDRNMKWSIHSFKPYKSPGLDGITPAHIQQAG